MNISSLKNYFRRSVAVASALALSAHCLALEPSAYIGGDCRSINGLYVSTGMGGVNGLLGDTAKENTFLAFVRDNGFNYLIMYGLTTMDPTSVEADQLASLISRAKTEYGIHQVGVALGNKAGADRVVAYNNAHAEIERIDVLNLEYEFWNHVDRTAAFNYVINVLGYFETLGASNNLETEIYIGWISAAEGAQLGDAADRILVHFYRQTDQGIINYGIERLQYLAAANQKVRIAPIFSNEGPANTNDIPFMGEWLETHPNDQAFKTWLEGYNALSAPWKSNLEVMGASWFVYDKFLDVNVGAQSHINSHPVDQAVCEGGSATFTVGTNASAADYCWMTAGRCLADGGKFSGTRTASLTVSNVSSADIGRYYARVISYDPGNPASIMSGAATLSLNTTCSP